MFQTKFAETINTRVFCLITFLPKIMSFIK